MQKDILKSSLGFDLYGRYAIIRDIINRNRVNGKKYRILDVGGRGNFLKKFLPHDDVFYLDPFVESDDENFIKGDGCAMSLEDGSFDWVTSADVFEHIPPEKRKDFIEENLRVAKLGVILTAPFYSREVVIAEVNANENYKIFSGGEDHIWLREHIDNGLPRGEEVESFLKNNHLNFQKLHNNRLFLWQNLLGISFFVQNNLDENIRKEFEEFNYFYNTQVFPFDGVAPSYRKIYFIKKDNSLKDLDVSNKPIDDFLFLDVLKRATDLIGRIDIANKKNVESIDQAIQEKDQTIQEKDQTIQEKDQAIQEKDQEIQQKNQELSYLNIVTDDLNQQLQQKEQVIQQKEQIIQQKEQIIQQKEQELNLIKNSLIWRTFTRTYGIYVRNVQRYVPKFIFRTIDFFLYRFGLRPAPANQNKKKGTFAMSQNPDKCQQLKRGVISFEVIEKPDVSIIIPVYNKWEFTCNCLISLHENVDRVPSYEVIVVDNASTDETSLFISQRFENVRYFKNQKNLGFVGGCNFGAKQARGKYLVFLNNDTLIKKGWLENLYKTFQDNKDIGLVGSKLIYPNGTLQEAGGIIWKNENACNYGNGQDPNNYEFNYLKDVDYCSGASIMISAHTFKRLNGFDDFYSPAYYEDTDLAFRVRQIGLRTVYQPKSELIHFEGGTAGKDVKQGLKKYQEINRNKFFGRWADVLEKENDDEKNGPFLARDKSKNKKVVLYVDWRVPNFDKDAGSFIAFKYLAILKQLGYKIVFWSHNLDKSEPYTEILQQMGVEVVYGNHSFRDFIIQNGKFIDFAFLSRPDISFSYMYLVKRYCRAKILYIAHDLHFLRELRSIEVSNNKEELVNIDARKERELLMIENADVSLFFSEDEKKLIRDILPNARASVIPWIQEILVEKPALFENREGIVFIGGFNHSPNVDAIKWFYDEIFPLVKKKLENITVTIFGSHPSQEIIDLADDNFKIVGFIEEEKIPVEFGKAKVFIAPLRFGAGFKGKIAKAMSNGLPVVTTDIGAEGMGLVDGENAMIANTSVEYAEKIVRLYTDEKLWKKVSENSIKHVKERYSMEKAEEMIKLLMK